MTGFPNGGGPPNEVRGFVHGKLFGAVKGFVGAVASGGNPITGATSGFFRGGRSRPVSRLAPGPFSPGTTTTTSRRRFGPFGIIGSSTSTRVEQRGGSQAGQVNIQANVAVVGASAGATRGSVAPGPDGACPRGFHLNKSQYFSKAVNSLIQPRTLCVRNRRRNPDNGTANMRAARRLVSKIKHDSKINETLKELAKSVTPARRRSSKPKQLHSGPIVVAS